MKSSLEIPKHWTFRSQAVAKHFDQHVRDSLPWYDLATNAVAHFGRHYIPHGGRVYDIGASTGNVGNAIRETLAQRKAKFTAIEESHEMADKYAGPPQLVVADAVSFAYEPFDFAVAFLVFMFLPVATRGSFLRRLQSLTKPGGALVILRVDAAAGKDPDAGQEAGGLAPTAEQHLAATLAVAHQHETGGVARTDRPRPGWRRGGRQAQGVASAACSPLARA